MFLENIQLFFLAVNQSAKSETLSLQSSTHSSRSNTLERPSKPNKDSGLQPRLPTHEVFFLGSKFHELRFYSKKRVSKLGNYRELSTSKFALMSFLISTTEKIVNAYFTSCE